MTEIATAVMERETTPKAPTFWEAFRFWVKLGFINFGGPTGQIAIMNTELVDKRRWISQERFLHALNYCMLLPGPEAQQLAIYIGWLLHRTWGGIAAGVFFVIPSIFILLLLSWIYAAYGNIPQVMAAFYGLKPVVTTIVASATIQIGRRALKNEVMILIALAAFLGIYFLKIPFPAIIVSAGLTGFISGKFWPRKFYVIKPHGEEKLQTVISDDFQADHTRPTVRWRPLRSSRSRALCGPYRLWRWPCGEGQTTSFSKSACFSARPLW